MLNATTHSVRPPTTRFSRSIGWVLGSGLHRFRLYGDGRLVVTNWGGRPGVDDVGEPVEMWLSREEIKAVVDTVVNAGVLDPSGSRTALPEEFTTEVGALWLRVSFASFRSPRRTEDTPFVYSNAINAPSWRAHRYREAKASGRIPESEPDTFVEAEVPLQLYNHFSRPCRQTGAIRSRLMSWSSVSSRLANQSLQLTTHVRRNQPASRLPSSIVASLSNSGVCCS